MRAFILLGAMCLFAGCRDDKEVALNLCGLTGSVDEIPVLAMLKDSIPSSCICRTSILTGTYEGQAVFWVAITDGQCNSPFARTLYNCEEKPVRSFGNTMEDYNEFFDKVTEQSKVYSCVKS